MEIAELFSQLLIDLQSLFRKNNKNLSLSLSQIVVLSSIPALGATMSSLSSRIGVDNSTLTRLINVLENKELNNTSDILLRSDITGQVIKTVLTHDFDSKHYLYYMGDIFKEDNVNNNNSVFDS